MEVRVLGKVRLLYRYGAEMKFLMFCRELVWSFLHFLEDKFIVHSEKDET